MGRGLAVASMIVGCDSRYWDGTRFPAALAVRWFGGKVSDGSWRPDDTRHLLLEHQRRACRQQGLPYLPFFYWRYNIDPIRQADLFAAKLDSPELPWALDFEDPYAPASSGLKVAAFTDECTKIFQKPMLCYTRKSWWDAHVDQVAAARGASLCDLWVAHYTAAPAPLLPRGWTDWAIWQWQGDVTKPGVNAKVDMNRTKPEWAAIYGIV